MKIHCKIIWSLSMLIIASIRIKAITKTSIVVQITTADSYNYKPKSSSDSFDYDNDNDMKQLKPEVASEPNRTTTTTLTSEQNSVLLTRTISRQDLTPTNRANFAEILMMTTGEIAISSEKPENFNKNSLQQQKLPKTTSSPHQRHYKDNQYTLDNKHLPCDYIEHEIVSENSSHRKYTSANSVDTKNTNYFKSSQIAAIAKGYKPLLSKSYSDDGGVDNIENNDGSSGSVSSAFTSSSLTTSISKMMTTPTTVFNVARNDFRDKINISYQRNELSNAVNDSSTTEGIKHNNTVNVVVLSQVQQQQQQQQQQEVSQLQRKRKNRETSTITSSDAESSFFERVELLQSNLSPDELHELLLHRRKRYLVFPEGSSFQLVFDLIIGIVDYTSYAILGITCSVAWELPSKPPSEIIESFRDKLNEGKLGLHRRNDTIENHELQYVDTKQRNRTAGTVASTQFTNFINDENAWKPQLPILNYYNKLNMQIDKPNGMSGNNFHKSATDSYVGNVAAVAEGDNFAKTQRKTLNEKEVPIQQHLRWYSNKRPNKDYATFYNNKVYYNKNSDEWNLSDKRKYATTSDAFDWHQPQHMHTTSNSIGSGGNTVTGTDGFVDNVGGSSDYDDYMADSFGAYQRKQQTNYAGNWQQKDNWWQRNKQRLQTKWHDKKQATFSKYANENAAHLGQGYTSKRPITDYVMPSQTNNAYIRTGRQRKILTAPPKHRIYPVFGRKKRSITNNGERLTTLELEMQRIHLREQLQSRQRLYGKIEQVFKTRGHNGTECVLRALCETGQRQHEEHQLHHHHHYHHYTEQHRWNRQPHSTNGQHREPQSFITELLRAIFALPRDIGIVRNISGNHISTEDSVDFKYTGSASASDSVSALKLEYEREYESHISWHYRDAHTYAGNCAVRFAGCELSIWDNVALDKGFGSGTSSGSDADTFGRTFKM